MSWQAASLIGLGLALGGGFAWYERSRPPSQVVALVAALAAVAIAGRVALAAVPNLVATTDIVLLAGWALGPAPGFVVGALAGLVSNLWLGQGPWTPWQMAAWGGVGIMGALLARFGPARPGRAMLAMSCGLAGALFGLTMNFSTMATFGGEISVDRFLGLQARAIPFDLMHVAGNVALALAAGPAILRMLVRFRERFDWRAGGGGPEAAPASPPGARSRLGRSGSVAALALAAVALSGLIAPGDARAAADVGAATGWLGSAQNADGGFGYAPGEDSSTVITGWAVLGLAAAGINAHDFESRGGRTPVGYLRRNAESVTSTGDLARTILALSAAGVEPRRFAGRNLVSELRDRARRSGSFEGWPNATAFAIMALRQAGSPGGLEHSAGWLRRVQNDDGGWGATPGAASDPDTTGAVLQAIGGTRTVREGVRYLRRAQRPSGGYSLAPGQAPNAQSTAWAVQGMIAAGIDPARVRRGERSAAGALERFQRPDGHFRYSAASDQTPVWVTAAALVAAAGESFPLDPPPREPPPDPDGGGQGADGQPSPPPGGGSVRPLPPLPPVGGGGGLGGGGLGRLPSPGGRPGPRGGTGGGNAVRPRPIDPATLPDRSGRAGSPDGGRAQGGRGGPGSRQPDAAEGPSAAELAAVDPSEVEERGPAPSPVAPTGIGLGLAGLTAGGMLWLGRRRGW